MSVRIGYYLDFSCFLWLSCLAKIGGNGMKRLVKTIIINQDGTYEKVDPEPTTPRPSDSSESKWLRELAYYGNTVCRIKDGSRWAELRIVPAGTYTVGGEQITVSLTYIVVTKNKAFLFDTHRYAKELKMWKQENA